MERDLQGIDPWTSESEVAIGQAEKEAIMKISRFAPLLLIGLVSCGVFQSTEDFYEDKARSWLKKHQVEHPEPVSWAEAKIQAQEWLEFRLKDPNSAEYRFPHDMQTFGQGQLLTVDVNAKNGFGGYTGYKRYSFFFVDQEIIRVFNGRETWKAADARNTPSGAHARY